MGNGSDRNKPCACGSGKKYKKCCMGKKVTAPLEPFLTGNMAEDFLEFLSQKTFLNPWVFRSPLYVSDGKEFSDVAIFFRDTLVLIEVKGNKFDPKNPQRYLKNAKDRHRQLLKAKNIAENRSKPVKFKNNYFEFETDFSEIKKIHLISLSTGQGEMELAMQSEGIDYSELSFKDVSRYLGFWDPATEVHNFTASEFAFASKHLDTLKDFLWYLDFEKKYLSNKFSLKEGQSAVAIIDTHREDLISLYVTTYYWDEDLNRTGVIDLNKIFGGASIDKADFVMYVGTNTRKSLEDDETYKQIKAEKKSSYLWDILVNDALSQIASGHMVVSGSLEKKKIEPEALKKVFEELSFTSRLDRVLFGEKIKDAEEKNLKFRNMFSDNQNNTTLFSYAHIEYDNFPTIEEQEDRVYEHLHFVWCRVKFGDKIEKFREKIKKALLISKHTHKGKTAYVFVLSDELKVEESLCREVGAI